jgi:formate hydrogenlyase subunit 6/NADH:ubiquinone oxidoreductase subunit I
VVCPVACIEVDPDHQESQQELREKFHRITATKEEHGVAVV